MSIKLWREIQKNYINTEIQQIIFGNRKSPQKFGRFENRGSRVALFVPEIWPEIQKNTDI